MARGESGKKFRSGLRKGELPSLNQILNAVASWEGDAKKIREEIQEYLENRNTIGSKLCIAYLEHKLSVNKRGIMARFLDINHSEIKSMPDRAASELSGVIDYAYRKREPVKNRATISSYRERSAKGKNVPERTQAFLEAESLSDLQIQYHSRLAGEVGAIVKSPLEKGDFDLVEEIYWHAISLAERPDLVKSFSTYTNGWNTRGHLLHDIVTTKEVGVDRIALFNPGRSTVTGKRCWRLAIAALPEDKRGSHFEEQPDPRKWQTYYHELVKNRKSNMNRRCAIACELAKVSVEKLTPATIYDITDLAVQAMRANTFMSDQVQILKIFHQMPKDEKWTSLANRIHNTWTANNQGKKNDPAVSDQVHQIHSKLKEK